jgi:hypothetical protein
MRGGIFAGISKRKFALMGAGNAVSIPVAKYLAERILQAEERIASGAPPKALHRLI